jgi:hypothetical protein
MSIVSKPFASTETVGDGVTRLIYRALIQNGIQEYSLSHTPGHVLLRDMGEKSHMSSGMSMALF